MSEKKTYLFQFPGNEEAKRFLDKAKMFDVLVQHPVHDSTQVLVQGTGSINFDLTMLVVLEDTATNTCHGTRIR